MAVLSLGCATTNAQTEKRLDEMSLRLAEVQRTVSALAARMETVENRLLLAQDEIETLKLSRPGPGGVGQVSVPELPTVTVQPNQGATEGAASEPGERPHVSALDTGESLAEFESQPYAEIDDEGRVIRPNGRNGRGRKDALPRGKAGMSERRKRLKRKAEADAVSEYREAMRIYKQGRIQEARQAFLEFLRRHPNHPYSDNAAYWAAECLYDQKDYDGARAEFARLLERYPKGNKVPDAMVKIALCMKMTGQKEEALRMLETVVLTYPGTSAAETARKLLESYRR